MDKTTLRNLLTKQSDGTANTEELKILEGYADSLISKNQTPAFSSEKEKNEIKKELFKRVQIKRSFQFSTISKIAASVLVLLGMSFSFWFILGQYNSQELKVITTGVGEQKTVTLNDGTVVLLNAQSTFKYPETFKSTNRNVELSGEAVFTVTKDPKRPFSVLSNNITTTVLGTIFNVNAYDNDSMVSVSLLEGSVKVTGLEQSVLIVPNQQSIFNLKSKSVQVQEFDVSDIMAWKFGDLVFNKTTFKQLKNIVYRKYGATLEYEDSGFADYTISGKFKNPDLETILKSICAAKSLQYKKTGTNNYLIF